MKRAWMIPLTVAVLFACSGKIEVSDLGTSPDSAPDSFSYDLTPDIEQDATKDATVPETSVSDGQPADGIEGPCRKWSVWSCNEDSEHLCKASCAAESLQLSCISSGHCVCGVSIGPCGQFEADSACGVCQKAVEAACCWPE